MPLRVAVVVVFLVVWVFHFFPKQFGALARRRPVSSAKELQIKHAIDCAGPVAQGTGPAQAEARAAGFCNSQIGGFETPKPSEMNRPKPRIWNSEMEGN